MRGRSTGTLVLGIVMAVAGIALAIATPILIHTDHDKGVRLRAEGIPVEATITATMTKQRSKAAADTIRLTYVYDGARHTATTRCGGHGGCAEAPPTTIQIWVDPHQPGEFVTFDGNTDDADLATSFLYVPAVVMILIGAGGIGVGFTVPPRALHRRPARSIPR